MPADNSMSSVPANDVANNPALNTLPASAREPRITNKRKNIKEYYGYLRFN